MKRIVSILAILIIGVTVKAQVLHINNVANMEELFKTDITTMSEFRERFNLCVETEAEDRLKAFLTLFNRNSESILNKQNLLMDFTNYVLSNKKRLSFADADWYADVLSVVKYKGQSHDMRIILKTECVQDSIYRWSIAGINGLKEVQIINDAAFGYIEPIDNELNFIDLDNRMQKDYMNAFGYKSSDVEISQLSIFLYLLKEHQISIELFDKIRYHFLSIPGYVFIVEHSSTPMNSGWLINDISTIKLEGKELYEKALLGNY